MKNFAVLSTLITLLMVSCSPQSSNGKSTPILPPVPAPLVKLSHTPTAKPACRKIDSAEINTISIFPETSAFDRIKGSEDARIALILYTDFDCTGCRVAAKAADQLLTDFPDQIKVIIRFSPQMTEKSPLAVQAAEAAALQDKYWEMYDLLFDQQPTWTLLTPDEFRTWIVDQAVPLGLDQARFEADLKSQSMQEIPAQAYHEANKAILHAKAERMPLPLMLINGEIYSGPPTYLGVQQMISLKLLVERQYTCPNTVIDPNRQYTAIIKTEKGDIAILLYADKAPITVNSFVFLARNGWFDNITFHRVIPGFMAQTGDPSGTGMGGPGYIFDNELNNLAFDRAGLVAMANAGPNTNGSQFFITYAPANQLSGGYTIFGEVIRGMDVAESLTPRIPEEDPFAPSGDRIISITIVEK